MSFGMHVVTAVLLVGGPLLIIWFRDEKKFLVGGFVVAGTVAGLFGLVQAVPDAGQNALYLWLATGLCVSTAVTATRGYLGHRRRAAAGQPQLVSEPVEG